MRIGHNLPLTSFPKATSTGSGPVNPIQPAQKVDLPLTTNEIVVYKPENFDVNSFLIQKGVEWDISISEPYLVLFKQVVFQMAFKIKEILASGGIKLEVTVKNDNKKLKPFTAVASETSERVTFYPFGSHSDVLLKPEESLGVKFDERDDLIYAVQYHGQNAQSPELAEVTLHLTKNLI